MTSVGPLRLIAFDPEDLAVISMHVQDATVLPEETAWLPREQRFALIAERFDRSPEYPDSQQRLRAGLHFERVTAVQHLGFDRQAATPATLLAVQFIAVAAPSGYIHLSFADGGAIRLQVECLEAAMADL